MRETVEYEGQTYDKIPVSKENDCTGCCFYKGRCLLTGTGSTSLGVMMVSTTIYSRRWR